MPAIGVTTSGAIDITQGASATLMVTVEKSGGFAGDVVVTVQGLPPGVTAAPLTIPSGATKGTLTFTAAATATVGGSTITIFGTGTGAAIGSVSVGLTVRAAAATGAFTMTFLPAPPLTISQGAEVGVTATITKTGGFTGPVTFTPTGAPTGLTISIFPMASANQTVVTGGSATIIFSASATLAVGTYPISISASGQGVTTQTVTFSTIVTLPPAGNGNVVWTFCTASRFPGFFAVQDGTTAPFVRVNAGANNTYTFSITQSKGAVAWEFQPSANNYQLLIFYGTQAEIIAQGATFCANLATPKFLNGTLVGLGPTDLGFVALGSATASVQGAVGTAFVLNNVSAGSLDLLAGRSTVTVNGSTSVSTLASILVRRNQNLASGFTISPSLDVSAISAEAVAPVFRNLTISGLNGNQGIVSASYATANGTYAPLWTDFSPLTATTRSFPTIPATKAQSGDHHYLSVLAAPSFQAVQTSFRATGTYNFASADRTLTLGPQGTAPINSNLNFVAPVRLRATIPVQPEYNNYYSQDWQQAGSNPRQVHVTYTSGYVGNVTSLNLDIPDLVPAGFVAFWGLQPLVLTNTTTLVAGWSGTGGIGGPPITERALYRYAITLGSLTP